jgi:hypothetical protein
VKNEHETEKSEARAQGGSRANEKKKVLCIDSVTEIVNSGRSFVLVTDILINISLAFG